MNTTLRSPYSRLERRRSRKWIATWVILIAAKVIDQVALMAVEAARPISGVSLAAMKDTYRQLFFSWLRSPAEEGTT